MYKGFSIAVHNAALSASSDKFTPILRSVRVDLSEGVVWGTDRYTLSRATFDGPRDGASFTLSLDDAKTLTKLPDPERITPKDVDTTAGTVEFVWTDGRTLTFPTVMGDYPAVSGLMPGEGSTPELGAGEIGLNPTYVARIAKAKAGVRHEKVPAHFRFYGPNKPVRVDIGDAFTFLIVPIRFAR